MTDAELDHWLAEQWPRAFRTACLVLRDRHGAQDAVQEAFLRVWRFRDTIPSEDGRQGWLYRVVVNACISRIRSERSRTGQNTSDVLLALRKDDAPGPEKRAQDTALTDDVLAALADLPEPLRLPLVLRFYAGLSEQEIAVAIERRPGTVKSRLHDARNRLSADPRLLAWVTPMEASS